MTHAQHLAPVIFVYAISFFYYFIVFRQLYEVCSKVSITCPEIWLLYLIKYCCERLLYLIKYCCEKLSKACRRDRDPYNQPDGDEEENAPLLAQAGDERLPDFSFTAFFIEIQAGFLLAGAEFFVLYSLEKLPIALVSVPIGIYHGIQLAFVLITGLFTYKIISKPDKATCQGCNHHGNTGQQATSYGATNKTDTGEQDTSPGATGQGNPTITLS